MRANSTISILSAAGGEKIAAPITAASRRRWKLMEEDSITLYFNLAESIDFAVGDYIVDEVFGRFVISEEPVPADYDPVSGAYKYTLRFDADWICWKNYILMLTYNGVRKETSWVLTDTLENHLAVVIQNLTAVGFLGHSVAVDASTVPDKGKAVCVTYSGTTILDALKNLADAYECEFWLDGKVIRFGKCLTGTMTDLSMTNENGRTINVENMVPMRNDSEYGNRFFAYGSTKNLPETYRKHLSFKADTTSRIGGYTAFKDSLRPMFPDFLKRSIVQTSNPTQHSYEDDWLDYSYTEEEDHDEMITWKNIRVEKTTNPIPVVQGWPFTITPYNSQYGSFQYTVYIYDQDGNLLTSSTNVLTPLTYTIPEGVDKITVRYSFESETHLSRPAPLAPTVEWLDNTEYAYFATVSYTGGTFLVRLMDGWFRAVKRRTGTVTYKNPPTSFRVNTEYTLLATGDDPIKVASIPYSYYTDDDDTTDSVRVLGERRLMLPRPPYTDSDLIAIQDHIESGYVQREPLSRDQVVERVVFFDEIYPRCALRITQVDVGEYANDTTYSDGSVKIANLPSYTLQAQLVTRSGDVAFPFDPETMMVVGKLTATFLTPDEAKVFSGRTTENACSLMGMTFDVACNRSNGVTTYQLVWNSDYGEKLPNEILMPKVGDCFILAGWNPAAMSTLGLIDAAEKELALTADRYAELLEEAQFNFDCTMMSDWVKAWYDGKTPVSGELPFRRLILPGQSVRVFHGALSAPKETRVIGFEYKLDIPYDSPVLTVGESDAYSRLREIEKSLHASSQSSTATSNTTSVNIAGGGGSVQGGQTLHLTPGTMTGMSPIDYNGSEEKTFRVPSVIDHLVDSDKVARIATSASGGRVIVDKDGNEVSGKQFFEEKTDPNDPTKKYVWLKDEYIGLGALGWITAGGIGTSSGGGGGGGTDLDRVWESLTNNTDKPNVKINVAHIPDLTTDKISNLETWISGKGFITSSALEDYATKEWVGQQGFLTSASLSSYATRNWVNQNFVASESDPVFSASPAAGITASDISNWNGKTSNTGTVTSVTLTSGTGITVSNSGTAITTSGSRTISISSAFQVYIEHGENAYNWGDHANAGYLTAVPKATDSVIGGFQTGYSESGRNYAVKMSGNKAYVNVPWTTYTHPTAGADTTIESAVGRVLSSIKVDVLGHVEEVDYKTLAKADIPALDYLPLTGGELTGDLWLHTGSENYGSKLWFGDKGNGDGFVYLHEDTDDHLHIHADKGIKLSTTNNYGIQLENNVTLNSARTFTLGNGVLSWDANANSWKLTGNLYATGYITSGAANPNN